VTLALTTIGAVIVAKVAHVSARRLGLELYAVLVWLGLAEDQRDELSARRTAALSEPRQAGARRRIAPDLGRV
jgi:hypothetical protein